ncbi:hypothetical protein DUI87_30484 [Hirundo rustica rustica]|uniref:FHA domain-containing protein n=1 Tax=Hirundo rustica rustica TaxID=333673 RepID=A0A3M0IUP6_HIRRU|nr:hypothetical protein DUI87_30484 [Hirundo rustica rustica]
MLNKRTNFGSEEEGIGVVLDAELPYLIGIDDDLLSTGIISYHLKEGQTYVGREDAITEQDIVLHGLDLESEHCIFKNLNGTVNLIPLNGMQCSVNGIQITEPTYLNQGEENREELEKAQQDFVEFKKKQLEQLAILEKDLIQQMDHLEKEIADENGALEHLKFAHEEHLNLKRDDENFMDAILKAEEVDKIKPVEYRLQSKLRQLEYLKSNHLPVLLEEKQRASEVLDRGLLGLDNTVYQIEKEIEEKEEQLAQYRASTNQLQQLQETFEFTANVARQEGKFRKKEKEILESREKQQREALEQAVAKLERRHSALQRRSTMDFEIEGQKQKLATLNNSCGKQAGLQDNERHNNSTIQRKLKYEMVTAQELNRIVPT